MRVSELQFARAALARHDIERWARVLERVESLPDGASKVACRGHVAAALVGVLRAGPGAGGREDGEHMQREATRA